MLLSTNAPVSTDASYLVRGRISTLEIRGISDVSNNAPTHLLSKAPEHRNEGVMYCWRPEYRTACLTNRMSDQTQPRPKVAPFPTLNHCFETSSYREHDPR